MSFDWSKAEFKASARQFFGLSDSENLRFIPKLQYHPEIIHERILAAEAPTVDGKSYNSYTNFPQPNTIRTTVGLGRSKRDLYTEIPEFKILKDNYTDDLKPETYNPAETTARKKYVDTFNGVMAELQGKGYTRLYQFLLTGKTSTGGNVTQTAGFRRGRKGRKTRRNNRRSK